jgi:hypothetical protein
LPFFVVVLIGLLSFDDLREAVEPLQPGADALEGVGRKPACADAADLLRRHELRLLEQPDVRSHSGQRHAEGLGELADRRVAGAEPFEDGAAGRVGKCRKGAVDGRWILNHWVHYNGLFAQQRHMLPSRAIVQARSPIDEP